MDISKKAKEGQCKPKPENFIEMIDLNDVFIKEIEDFEFDEENFNIKYNQPKKLK